MRANASLSLILIFLFALSEVGNAQCTVVQDQVDTYLYTQEDFGQSFQPCTSGHLTELDFLMHNFLNGDIMATLTLFEGEGYDGMALYSSPITLVEEWGASVNHLLSDSVFVIEGEPYTFRVEIIGDEYGVMWGDFTDGFAEGQLFWNGIAQETIDMGFNATIEPTNEVLCISWTGAMNNDWNQASNWSPEEIPDSTDCVIIPEVESQQYPIVPDEAQARSLTIESAGQFTLHQEGLLSLHGDLNSFGDCQYEGQVNLASNDGDAQINGSPIFDRLKISGVFFTTESIEILNVLDLSDGYLANFGSELFLNSGNGYSGHAYIPNEIIVGHVIIKKHIEQIGEQIIGLPFIAEQSVEINEDIPLDDILTFEQTQNIDNFSENWTLIEELESNGPCDAIRTSTAQEFVLINGQTTNEDMLVLGSSSPISDNGQLKLVANPYPSVIDLDELVISPEASTAAYSWLPRKQQFGSRNGGLSTHEMGSRLLPTEAVIVQLAENQQLKFIYTETALEPWDLNEAETLEIVTEHQVKLTLEAAGGIDEMLVRLTDEALHGIDAHFDALKIPSINEFAPTIGSASSTGEVLSINGMPHPPIGTRLPLYVSPNLEGPVSFTPSLIDVGSNYSELYLYDSKYDIFHALLSSGVYQTDFEAVDGTSRFELIFGIDDLPWYNPSLDVSEEEIQEQTPPQAGLLDQTNSTDEPSDWNIGAVDSEIVIKPIADTSDEDLSWVRIHGLNGKLVFERKVAISSSGWQQKLHVSSGIYAVSVTQGDDTYSEKVWID